MTPHSVSTGKKFFCKYTPKSLDLIARLLFCVSLPLLHFPNNGNTNEVKLFVFHPSAIFSRPHPSRIHAKLNALLVTCITNVSCFSGGRVGTAVCSAGWRLLSVLLWWCQNHVWEFPQRAQTLQYVRSQCVLMFPMALWRLKSLNWLCYLHRVSAIACRKSWCLSDERCFPVTSRWRSLSRFQETEAAVWMAVLQWGNSRRPPIQQNNGNFMGNWKLLFYV